MFATNWAQVFVTIAATCALPSLVVGYVGVLRPALARAKGRQMEGWHGDGASTAEVSLGPARSPLSSKTEQ